MKRFALIAAPVLAVVLAVGLWAFEPWRAFTSSEIDEALPGVQGVATAPAAPTATAAPAAPAGPTVLSSGRFVDAEHDTSGTARIIELADGRRFLRLEDLASSDGPDLHVWLSDRAPGGSWFSYDDGDHLALGELKATHGNQNYELPSGTDLGRFRSAVIWCDRFNVAFGAAPVAIA